MEISKKSGHIDTPILVGAGGQYSTVEAAIAAGQYDLKLISNVTETAGFTLTGNTKVDCNSFTWTMYNANHSLSTYTWEIFNGNINWSGTYRLFSSVVRHALVLRNLVFTKTLAASDSVTSNGYIENVHFICSSGNYGSVDDFEGTMINCSVTGNGAYAISCANECDINGLWLYGSQIAIKVFNARNIIIDSAVTGRGTFQDCINLLSNASGFDVITARLKFGTIADYTIGTTGLHNQNLDSVTIENATVTINRNNCKYINCIFTGTVVVSGDGNTFQNCYLAAGTITVSASADKTVLIGNRTQTAISDSGTNTTDLANNLI